MRLVTPGEAWKGSYLGYVAELDERGESPVPFPLSYDPSDFPALVARLEDEAAGRGLPSGFVSNSTYWLVDSGEQVVGVSNLRHRLTERLRREGGHIGYGVRPSARGRGVGKALLAKTLEEACKRDITRALITCDRSNFGSIGVILANGGVFSDEGYVPERDAVFRRYWIDLAI